MLKRGNLNLDECGVDVCFQYLFNLGMEEQRLIQSYNGEPISNKVKEIEDRKKECISIITNKLKC